MKFLCPSCKAKYQIADEKVAGRSVRMKCRKCGYLISISKAVTDGSVSRKLSSMPPPSDSMAEPALPPPARAPAEALRAAEPARPPPKPPPPRPARAQPSPVAPPARPRTPHAPGVAAALAPAPVGHHEPEPVSPKNGNGQHALSGFGHGGLVRRDEDERTVIAGIGALAGAFSESVAGPDSSALVSSLASTDEWYVGINGVPVGPIRLSELRSKAAAGAISVESLVWREGFEQWMPLSHFPELVAIVEEGLSSARASLTPLSPPTSQAAPPAAPRPEVYDPFAAPGTLGDPFAAPRQAMPSAEPIAVFGSTSPLAVPVGPIPGPAIREAPLVDMEDVLPPRRTGTSPFAWVAVGVAMMLGLVIGFVAFSKKPPDPVVKYVEVPAKGGEGVAPSGVAQNPETAPGDVESDAGAIKIARTGGTPGTPGKPGEPSKTDEKPLSGLSGLSGLQGPGPTTGPGTTGSTGGGGQPLDSGEIQKTVGKYTGSVKRSCWQPALDARQKDAPTSARVNVSINVSPSGSVQSASTSGDPKGYPGLASCIQSRVKAWQFPASSGTTTVNVPFVFAAQ